MCDDKQPTKVDTMTDDPDFNPVEDALERSPWCLLVQTEDPDEPDIIGPFASSEDAIIWSRTYPGAIVRNMASPELEALLRREWEEDEAWKDRVIDPRKLAAAPEPDRRSHLWRAHISRSLGTCARASRGERKQGPLLLLLCSICRRNGPSKETCAKSSRSNRHQR